MKSLLRDTRHRVCGVDRNLPFLCWLFIPVASALLSEQTLSFAVTHSMRAGQPFTKEEHRPVCLPGKANSSRKIGTVASVTTLTDDNLTVATPLIRKQMDRIWDTLERWYNRASQIRCPFLRRRTSDAIDSAALVAKFLLIRHKSILPPDLYCPPGCRSIGKPKGKDGTVLPKMKGLPIENVAEFIRLDWGGDSGNGESKVKNSKGYYITGKLNTLLYRDDCLFNGPDPDMPVRGLRKYLAAASHLFDQRQSYAELLQLTYSDESKTVSARWKIRGVLMLPWRPVVKPWTGTTTYHLDETGLIYLHDEKWDISVLEAFVCTVYPELGKTLWGKEEGNENGDKDDLLGASVIL